MSNIESSKDRKAQLVDSLLAYDYTRTTIPADDLDDKPGDSSKHSRHDLESFNVLRQISSLATYPIIGMIFHPAYGIFNSIVAG